MTFHLLKQNQFNTFLSTLHNYNLHLITQLNSINSSPPLSSIFSRFYSTNSKNLTHVDSDGKAKMVDVSRKLITDRYASAKAIVYVGSTIAKLIHQNNISKGDVLSISQVAGILGAKKTSELIPLCHNIVLSSVKVNIKLEMNTNEVIIISKVNCTGKTGVEMEALMAVSIASLTIYDMCKAVSHDIIIKDIRLLEKYGGKNNYKIINNNENDENEKITLKYKTDILDKSGEKFYPLYV